MTAYYNEFDPKAAAWLRELIRCGHIAPGIVDERSIDEVRPADLAGFTQCHFFAGIGVWSYALRLAGWPDDRPVWTGSCPCQPFSDAGAGGEFDDARHLWPAWFRLIRECRPVTCFGEQVASKDALAWLDHVSTDLEGEAYTFGAVDTCAAGFGAPHIRQRLFFVAARGVGLADSGGARCEGARLETLRGGGDPAGSIAGADGRGGSCGRDGVALGDPVRARLEGHERDVGDGHQPGRVGALAAGSAAAAGGAGVGPVADTSCERRQQNARGASGDEAPDGRAGRERGAADRDHVAAGAGPVNGFWADADWLPCRDGKARPVEPGTFPLAHGAPERVGRLRGYGNGLVAQQAAGFIEAFLGVTS